MGHWSEAKIKDFAEVKGGKRLPKGKQLIKESNSHPYIKVRNLGKEKYIQLNSDYEYVDDETQKSIARYIVNKGDILISVVGTIGLVGIVGDTLDKANQTENCDKIINIKDVLPEYLYYYLISSFGQDEIRKGTVGAVQPKLPLKNVKDISILYPLIEEQERIVNILSSIDKKIEMNNAINNNLEQQIEMILLKTINGTDTQLVKLGDYLYIKGRIGWKGLKKSEYLPISNYRIINGESLTLSGIDWNKAGYISAERYEESPEIMLSIGDILLSKDGTIGKIGYVDKLDVPTSVASGIFVIRNTRESEISTQFIYYLLKSKLFKAFISSRTEGSVIPHLYQKDFMEFEFKLPSPDDMKAFDSITATMFSLVFSNLNENERLTHLRNSLLPKLMSGELDVSNIDI